MCPNPPAPQGPDPRPDAVPGSGPSPHKRKELLVHHFKIDEKLSAEDRAAYEALMLDPRQTMDSLLAWLRERGYLDISRAAVARHRRNFEKDVKDVRKTARVACQFAALARAQGGAGGLADAGQFRFEQMFFERLFDMKADERLSGKEWADFGKAMSALLENREKYETLRAEWQSKAERAVATIEKAGKGGRHDGVALSNAVRRIFGVPLPGEPVPARPGQPTPEQAPPAGNDRNLLPPPGEN